MHARIDLKRYPLWLIGLIAIPLALAGAALAIFFFSVFLVFFGVLALVVAARLWWRRRKQRHAVTRRTIEGEYSVEPERRERKM